MGKKRKKQKTYVARDFAGEPVRIIDPTFVPEDTTLPDAVYDDVLLAYSRYSPPRPMGNSAPMKYTLRQRLRIWRYGKRHDVHQWIHDHLDHASCDC